MTLAQNLLRLLNGNKSIAFLLVILLISSCASNKNTSKANATDQSVTAKQDKSDSILVNQDSLRLAIEQMLQDSIARVHKDTYNFAVILPFYLDSLNRDSIPKENKKAYKKSLMAVEFYQGIMLALDSLKELGLNSDVLVFDSQNDARIVRQIVGAPDLKNVDLIFGPIYNTSLRIVSEFALRDSIHMISPLSPAANITENNPYYIMVNPTIEVHCKRIFDFVMDRYVDQNVLIMSQPSSVEWEYAKVFDEYLSRYQESSNDYSMFFTDVIYIPQESDEEYKEKEEDFAPYFDPYRENIIIVPSVDRAYIHNISRKLNSMVEEYEITVVGLPIWGEYQYLRMDYIDKLNVHFTSSSFIEDAFYQPGNKFYKTHIDAFKTEPSEYFVKGFDIMLYFGKMIQKYGLNFSTSMIDKEYPSIHTHLNFGIHPVETNDLVATIDSTATSDTVFQPVKINYIENKYVHLLKYENYTIKKVN